MASSARVEVWADMAHRGPDTPMQAAIARSSPCALPPCRLRAAAASLDRRARCWRRSQGQMQAVTQDRRRRGSSGGEGSHPRHRTFQPRPGPPSRPIQRPGAVQFASPHARLYLPVRRLRAGVLALAGLRRAGGPAATRCPSCSAGSTPAAAGGSARRTWAPGMRRLRSCPCARTKGGGDVLLEGAERPAAAQISKPAAWV